MMYRGACNPDFYRGVKFSRVEMTVGNIGATIISCIYLLVFLSMVF